jgi:hypothetical protein
VTSSAPGNSVTVNGDLVLSGEQDGQLTTLRFTAAKSSQ